LGRIVCALGYSGTEFIPENVVVYLDDLLMVENGSGVDFDEAKAGRILGKEKIVITVDLQAGEFTGTAWGCDLSYEYVKINADYRS